MSYRQPITGSCTSIALPSAVKFSEESESLAEKRARQIRWMQERGIDLKFKDKERPSAAEKRPLPGTVIYFSSASNELERSESAA